MNFVKSPQTSLRNMIRSDSLRTSPAPPGGGGAPFAPAAAGRGSGTPGSASTVMDRPPLPTSASSSSSSSLLRRTSTTASTHSLQRPPGGSFSGIVARDLPTQGVPGTGPTRDVPDVAAMIPLDKHYGNLRSRGVVGQHWQLFDAVSVIGKTDVSLLVFEKKRNIKAPSRIGRNRLSLIDLLRYDVTQLSTVVHPKILRILHGFEENKDVASFAAETIYGSLDQIMVDEGMDKLEMKLGVLQIIDGISYLHNSGKILHGNLTPAAIYITSSRLWKIGGFQFAVASSPKHGNSYPCYPWTKKLPVQLQPDLDFLAPEYLNSLNQSVTTAADVFSLGVLICWIYSGGKRLIDANNNLESYNIIINQLDMALALIADDLGHHLAECIAKVVSKDVAQRPAVQMMALIKHFDDPTVAVLRQLDDIAQEFDPAHKSIFIAQNLLAALPMIPEGLWFSRVLQRFNENLTENADLYPAILKPLIYMLANCESHNIYKLRVWFRRICDSAESSEELTILIMESLPVIFRRLNDEKVEDKCYIILMNSLKGTSIKSLTSALRAIPSAVEFMSASFIREQLIPVFFALGEFFKGSVPNQMDLLNAIAYLSDRCDSTTLHVLLSVASLCDTQNPSVIHAKSRLVQKILHTDVSRLSDTLVITTHLLQPLIVGLSLPELTSAHFDDIMSSTRILLDIIEQIRYERDEASSKRPENGRLYNRRVSMSSSHLPRLLVTAARPSFSSDNRKMSFLSADGRLEDRGGRRESNQSKSSVESDMSILIGNGSELSDESGIVTAQKSRRKSWMEGYIHSMSLEQNKSGSILEHRRSANECAIRHHQSARSARSPANGEFESRLQQQQPARPNSFTNLGHNLACTLWKTFY